jgi:hypothetical protein
MTTKFQLFAFALTALALLPAKAWAAFNCADAKDDRFAAVRADRELLNLDKACTRMHSAKARLFPVKPAAAEGADFNRIS